MSHFSGRLSPTRTTTRSCSARSSFTCMPSGSSPISSRNSVPPSACWNLPARLAMAPVKAPFTWPNSSLSIRFSGMAPQLMVTNGPLTRLLRRWSSRAISSLPVPVSPVMSTLMSVAATFCSLRNTSIIEAQAPMISPKRLSSSSALSFSLSARSALSSIAFCKMSDACAAKMVSKSSWRRSNRCFTSSLPRTARRSRHPG